MNNDHPERKTAAQTLKTIFKFLTNKTSVIIIKSFEEPGWISLPTTEALCSSNTWLNVSAWQRRSLENSTFFSC